ncbi:MAG: NUDIX domain-containing protein, partial [Asgard group archaeon]|nr:NUDIX domain-containing protein [Asgard group archaeon]
MSNQVKKEVTLGYRVGGVLIRNGKILLQSDPLVKFWVLPGGSPKPFEASDKALIRELKEEIGLQIETERLLFVIENSGEFGGRYFYGVELMYLIKPKGGSEILDQEEFIGIEDDLG